MQAEANMHGEKKQEDYIRGLQYELYWATNIQEVYKDVVLERVDKGLDVFTADFYEPNKKIWLDIKEDNEFPRSRRIMFEVWANITKKAPGWGLRYMKMLHQYKDRIHKTVFVSSDSKCVLPVKTRQLCKIMYTMLPCSCQDGSFLLSKDYITNINKINGFFCTKGVTNNKDCHLVLIDINKAKEYELLHQNPITRLPIPFEETITGIDWNISAHRNTKDIENDLNEKIKAMFAKKTYWNNIIKRETLKANPDKIYVFGDNLVHKGLGGMAKEMRGEPNAYGIPTKKEPNNKSTSFMIDDEYDENVKAIQEAVDLIPDDREIIIPDGIGCGLADLPTKAPKTYAFLSQQLKMLKNRKPAPKVVTVKAEIVDEQKEKRTITDNMAHLHVHSYYSLLDAVSAPEDIVKFVAELGQPAVALTDHGYMFGNYKFQQACNEYEVKPVHGCEMYYTDDIAYTKDSTTYHLILLAMNRIGWSNLCHLNTLAGKDGFYRKPRIDASMLAKYNEGIICTSACYAGPVSFHIVDEGRDPDKALHNMLMLKKIFGDRFYKEVMHINWEPYDSIVPELIDMADQNGIKIIATNDTHFARKEDVRIKDLMMKIAGWEYEAGELFIKSSEEMLVAPIEQRFLDTTLEIVDRVDFSLNDIFGEYIFPSYDIAKDKDYKQFLRDKQNAK